MSFLFAEVDEAIRWIRSALGCTANEQLQEQFGAGLHPNLLSYHKGHTGTPSIPVLDRYLVGATSYLHQPSTYYDIFGAGRCVILVQLLHSALKTLRAKKANGLAARTQKLMSAVDLDVFDSTAFEVITAARYASLPVVGTIEFIDEQPPKKTPDFMVFSAGLESSVECKKVARVRDYGVNTRSSVKELLNEVISSFRERGVAFAAEVVFHGEPDQIMYASLRQACQAALDTQTAIITSQFTVTATRLQEYRNKDLFLYPSPAFSWDRYRYRIRGEWFGIVHQLIAKPALITKTPKHLRGGQSTWIDKVDWDAAIKWKISAEDVVAKYRRFPFDNLFDAIKQINGAGFNSTIHLWLETDYFIGGRREVLLDFFKRLSTREHKPIGWILVNETLIDVSPKGRFDLIEHAHIIRGPTATTPNPVITGIFGQPGPRRKLGEFGIGHELPDIDED